MAEKHIQLTTHTVEMTQHLGQILGAMITRPVIIALTGELGSGKTAFVQGLASGLEVPEKYYITSPTFTFINEYPGRHPLWHVDLYRIEDVTALEEIGLDEVLRHNGVIAIEWADKLPEKIRFDHLAFQFQIISDDSRQIDIYAYGHPADNLLKALKAN
jgi:tRNA threonylcarbamoyladenosine biosynthesis protein TsaE